MAGFFILDGDVRISWIPYCLLYCSLLWAQLHRALSAVVVCACHIKQYRLMCVLLQRVTCTIQRCLLGSTCLRGRWQNSTCSLFGSFRVRCLASAATFSNSCMTCEIMSQPFSVVSVFWHSLWMCVWIRWYFKDRFAVDTDSAGMNVCDFLAPCNGTL